MAGRWRTPQGAPVVIQKSKQSVSSPHEHRETAEPKVLPDTVRTDGVKVPKSSTELEDVQNGRQRSGSWTLPDRTSILCNTQNSLQRSSVGRWRGRRSMVRVGRQNRRQAGTRDGRGVPFGQETPGGGERDEAHESATWSSKPCPKPMCKSFGSIEHWLLGHRRTQPVVNTAGTSMSGAD